MTLVGNPKDYIMIFGGSSYETITRDGVETSLKKTLDDVWIFYIGKQLWSQVFVNSKENPAAREYGTLVTVKSDRLVLLYGGQWGETLYSDVWQYNLNTNMWAKLNIMNEGLSTSKNCSTCS